MTSQKFHLVLGVTSLLALGLSAFGWLSQSMAIAQGVIGAIAIPVFWIIVNKILRKRPLTDQSPDERTFLFFSIVMASSVIVVAQFLKLFGAQLPVESTITPILLERSWGFAVGAVLLITGNLTPKILPPLKKEYTRSKEFRAYRNFAGRCFFFAGIGYMAAWLLLPLSVANLVATGLCAMAVASVAAKGFIFRQHSKKEI